MTSDQIEQARRLVALIDTPAGWYAANIIEAFELLSTLADEASSSAVRDAEDAARYRWLRDKAYWHGNETGGSPWVVFGTGIADAAPIHAEEIDAAIDAARAPQEGAGEKDGA